MSALAGLQAYSYRPVKPIISDLRAARRASVMDRIDLVGLRICTLYDDIRWWDIISWPMN